jgi:hypothetical protein
MAEKLKWKILKNEFFPKSAVIVITITSSFEEIEIQKIHFGFAILCVR